MHGNIRPKRFPCDVHALQSCIVEDIIADPLAYRCHPLIPGWGAPGSTELDDWGNGADVRGHTDAHAC